MIKLDASVIVETKDTRSIWCVYEHQAVLTVGDPPVTVFIGASRLMEVFHMNDARRNSEWRKMFDKGGQVLVRIVGITHDRAEAFRVASEMIRNNDVRPRCNALGYNTSGARRPIVCLENGKRYESQLAAAEDLGIYSSTISRQLRGLANTAQGFRFAYLGHVGDGE